MDKKLSDWSAPGEKPVGWRWQPVTWLREFGYTDDIEKVERLRQNGVECTPFYITPPDAQAQIDAAQEELRLCQQDAIKLQDECVALKAERDRLFNLLRKCAHAMDAGRIDVDLIEEVRALFHKDRA